MTPWSNLYHQTRKAADDCRAWRRQRGINGHQPQRKRRRYSCSPLALSSAAAALLLGKSGLLHCRVQQ